MRVANNGIGTFNVARPTVTKEPEGGEFVMGLFYGGISGMTGEVYPFDGPSNMRVTALSTSQDHMMSKEEKKQPATG
jgi:hypothetical protein